MAQKKKNGDERKERSRFVDQPGQWKNTTPASVKRRQDREMQKLVKMMGGKKSVSRKKK